MNREQTIYLNASSSCSFVSKNIATSVKRLITKHISLKLWIVERFNVDPGIETTLAMNRNILKSNVEKN